MKLYFYLSIILGASGIHRSCEKAADPHVPTDLRCEYLVNPIGIDSYTPRLRWKINAVDITAVQSGYRIVMDTDSSQVVKCYHSTAERNAYF